ncbi:hypothetical protein BGZ63DRAFT_371823 [Mariannaea sp. PMI_226]|nr:hypothetical protein BGZ63DRAFT_371823 [Mariannaea sp. PMI_226]
MWLGEMLLFVGSRVIFLMDLLIAGQININPRQLPQVRAQTEPPPPWPWGRGRWWSLRALNTEVHGMWLVIGCGTGGWLTEQKTLALCGCDAMRCDGLVS